MILSQGGCAQQQDDLKSINDDDTIDTDTASLRKATMNDSRNDIEKLTTTPRRKTKKRREEGFVYAEDAKAEKSASLTNNENIEQHKPASTNIKRKAPQPRKRPRKCPAKDSILIEVPPSVTGDLGVAVQRTRRKRIKRIKKWAASCHAAAAAAAACACASAADTEVSGLGGESLNSNNKESSSQYKIGNGKKGVGEGGDKHEKEASSRGPNEDELMNSNSDGGGPSYRKQYGSVLDYLEAKYVRGVMIEDFDKRERDKQRKKESSGSESEDSEGKGSCYDSDGWIDDSLLHEEINGQVMASSSYGMTRIEEDARKRKLNKYERAKNTEYTEKDDGDQAKKISVKIPDMVEDVNQCEDDDDSNSFQESRVNSDLDDGFFVNLGDLEMAKGWKGENVVAATTKEKHKTNKGKKRAYNKKSSHWDKKPIGTAAKCKMTKKKSVNAKATTPVPKKKTKKTKKGFISDAKAGTNKERNSKIIELKEEQSDDKSKKANGILKNSNVKSKKKKMDNVASLSEKQGKVTAVENIGTAKKSASSKATREVVDKGSKAQFKPPNIKKEAPSEITKEKKKAIELRKRRNRTLRACVKMIKEMTSEELPRKRKKASMIKVSVNIPPDKSIGDEITFGNPNVPGQKLKVKIPKKADMEKRNFVVSVPAPKVTGELRENNFSKKHREALHTYSCAYDDWCVAEGKQNASLPKEKRKKFKLSTEKQKKFDRLMLEFPKNLAVPMEVSYLRKIVRQERSNKLRRDKRKDGSFDNITAGGDEVEQQKFEFEICVPHMGIEFSSLVFHRLDFEGK